MPPRKSRSESSKASSIKGNIEGAGEIVVQPITDTLEKNYMPYAMSVIVSRALPEIDGFKPSHRKLLYTMYKMGLLTGPRTKSANVVGSTMKLNPHGDAAIYETMVRLARGNESLLHPFVDSKGNFGKAYSRDMMYAASRYTEVKLDAICQELFREIDKDTVDFIDNYDATMKEPTLLPASFPTVLINANTGIAVSMASSICPFNLKEVCETTIALMKDPSHDIASTLTAPDFPGGGKIIYNRDELEAIYRTGRGGIRVRADYLYDKNNHCIDITQIPPTTTAEAIIDKVVDLVKAGKVREIADIRDETGLGGLKITIDLKRGVNPDQLMLRLFKMTPLEDTFSCNFNVLISGMPRVLGVCELLEEWIAFRVECIKRRVYYDLHKAKEKLHLLRGLSKILLDIDKAVAIVRGTQEEDEVVPNLMIGFGIDQIQAEYVAEIRLRHLNREYILKRTEEIRKLEEEITNLTATFESRQKVERIIIDELRRIMEKYGKPRKTELLHTVEEAVFEEAPLDYPVYLFLTKEGYFKKVTPQSLRMSGAHKLKEGDEILQQMESFNNAELLFFTDRAQVYKCRAADFDDTKVSLLGDYVPAKLGMDEGELVRYMAVTKDYGGFMLFFFANGKLAKVGLNAYATKTNRRKLIGAYSDKSPLAGILQVPSDCEVLVKSSADRLLLVNTALVSEKSKRDTIGVAVMTLRQRQQVEWSKLYTQGMLATPDRYRTKSLPVAGSKPSAEDSGEQMTL